jgi:multicomponent Na+:H+ antiporter subunit F
MTAIAICGFLIAGLCGTYRILVGPTLADRIVALDVTLISLMGAITVDAARRDDPTNLVLLVVLAIVGFTATVATSQFIEADREPEDESQSSPQAEAGPYEELDPEPDADREPGEEIRP